MNLITNINISFPFYTRHGLSSRIVAYNSLHEKVMQKDFETIAEFKEILNELELTEYVEINFNIKKSDMSKDPYIVGFIEDILVEINCKNN